MIRPGAELLFPRLDVSPSASQEHFSMGRSVRGADHGAHGEPRGDGLAQATAVLHDFEQLHASESASKTVREGEDNLMAFFRWDK